MVGVAGTAGEVVVPEAVDVGDTGLLADLGQDGAREDLGPEDGPDLLRLHLPDEVRDLLRGGVLEAGDLDGADDLPPVVGGEVGVGVVVGEQLPVVGRHGGGGGLHASVEIVDLRGEGRSVRPVGGGVGGVGLAQHARRDGGVARGHRGVRPQVRVRLAARLGEREVVQVLARVDRQRAELDHLARRRLVPLGDLLDRVLELEAVDEDHIRGGDQLGDARLGFVGVGVLALGDHPTNLGPVAGHVGHDAGDRRHRGDHLELPPNGGPGPCLARGGKLGSGTGTEPRWPASTTRRPPPGACRSRWSRAMRRPPRRRRVPDASA